MDSPNINLYPDYFYVKLIFGSMNISTSLITGFGEKKSKCVNCHSSHRKTDRSKVHSKHFYKHMIMYFKVFENGFCVRSIPMDNPLKMFIYH